MAVFTSINPTTEQEIEAFAIADAGQIEHLLSLAGSAQGIWSRLSVDERVVPIRQLATVLRQRSTGMAARITAEMGKPIKEATAEIEKCAVTCEYFADNAARFLADLPAPSDSPRSFVAFHPLGVVLAVMPWNYPYWQVIRAAIPAICAGNAVMLKHAPNVLGCAQDLESAFAAAGFPAGTFSNLIVEAEKVTDLIGDQRIAAVTLTGSERAGIAVASAAGASLKKAVLELGGSDAFVVLADADIEAAARVGVASRFQNAGQSCIAAKRFIVAAPVVEQFTQAFVAQVEILEELGPLARKDLRDNLERQVEQTLNGGARLLAGGSRPRDTGWFYQATVLDKVTPDMVTATEEVFGPVASIITVGDEDEALEVANASRFGLGGNLWTGDVQHGLDLAARFESGGVFINGMTHSDARLPFGGVKHSGLGRELYEFGIREFTNIQTVWIP